MMTKTQFTDAIRNIRKQIIPWISVVVIGMVALIAYLGLVYSGEAIKRAVSAYYQKYNFWDIEISSTLLMTEDDLTALRAVPGVERAEPVWTAGVSILTEGRPVGASLQALSTEISVPELLEGRLPAAAGECALEQQLQSILGLRIGDRVRRPAPAFSGISLLRETEYTVTGIIRSPDHISYELPETPYLLVTEESFNREALDGAFMKTRIRVEGAPEYRYSAAYREAVKRVTDAAADRERFNRFSSIVDVAVLLMLGLAGVMAYFIVMNLSVTYIQRKTKELTIMRINGFTVRECVIYVSWDLVVTTLIGILLGLAAGHCLGQTVLPVAEGHYMRFVHEPDLRTYLYSALITAGFFALVSSTALRRVKNLKLSDIT